MSVSGEQPAQISSPLLVEAEFPPLDERAVVAEYDDPTLVRSIVTELMDPLDRDQAVWAVEELIRAAKAEPQTGRGAALLLGLTMRLTEGPEWMPVPNQNQKEQQ